MIAVFANQEVLNNVLPLPSGVNIGIPVLGSDGRVAICHMFSEGDLSILTQAGADISEQMPDDWQYQTG